MDCSMPGLPVHHQLLELAHTHVHWVSDAIQPSHPQSILLSLFAILWNSACKWVYLSFSPLVFASLLYTATCNASSDSHFAFLHFFFLGRVLIPVSWTSIHSSSGTPSIRSSPLNLFLTSTVDLNGLAVFPTFFNLSLNLAIRSSWSEPQSAPGLVFADCIELLHFWLQRI